MIYSHLACGVGLASALHLVPGVMALKAVTELEAKSERDAASQPGGLRCVISNMLDMRQFLEF